MFVLSRHFTQALHIVAQARLSKIPIILTFYTHFTQEKRAIYFIPFVVIMGCRKLFYGVVDFFPKRVRYQTAPYPVCFSEGANILHTFYTSFFKCKVEVSKASSPKKKVIICYLTVASTVFFKFGIFRLSMFPSLDSSLISFSKSLLTFVNPI